MTQNTIPIEPLDYPRDADSMFRLWTEIGWLDPDPKHKIVQEKLASVSEGRVARMDGAVECMALGIGGRLRYLDADLSACCVAGVSTSYVARRMGLAGRVVSAVLADSAARGAHLAILGMFDQGFYNKLGFGTGPYEHTVTVDPAMLQIDAPYRAPARLTADDFEAVHASRLARSVYHGNITMPAPNATLYRMHWGNKQFGLGYRNDAGELTHHVWLQNDGGLHGPYHVFWYAYQTAEQLIELLALLRSLGDQVHTIAMREPAGVQLQDLIPQPIKNRRVTENSAFGPNVRCQAWWQVRMLDVPGCLAASKLDIAEPVRFNLTLSDPVDNCLDADIPWRGVSGKYVVTLGAASHAVPGADPSLPTLAASVGAFTRMWLGVRPANGLAITDELAGPPDLLAALDRALRLPVPRLDWEF